MALLRRAFSWAAERPRRTGLRLSPFATLTKAQRRKLFPKGARRGYVFSPEQLRRLYAILPPVSERVVRFAAHTAMRLREILRLKWGAVDLEGGKLTVLAKYAKNGQEREVPLGAVALGILTALRPENPNQEAHVFLGETGEPVKTVYSGFVAKVEKVWKPEKPGQARPRFHDLRKTAATRVEAVSSHAIAKALLGHAAGDVTDTYLLPDLDEVRAALDRAARSIDGEAPEGAIPFRSRVEKGAEMARHTAQEPVSQVAEQ
jgi:integrase